MKLIEVETQQTRYIEPMSAQCWADVYDVGPTLSQHWYYVSCLLGSTQVSTYFLFTLRCELLLQSPPGEWKRTYLIKSSQYSIIHAPVYVIKAENAFIVLDYSILHYVI